MLITSQPQNYPTASPMTVDEPMDTKSPMTPEFSHTSGFKVIICKNQKASLKHPSEVFYLLLSLSLLVTRQPPGCQ